MRNSKSIEFRKSMRFLQIYMTLTAIIKLQYCCVGDGTYFKVLFRPNAHALVSFRCDWQVKALTGMAKLKTHVCGRKKQIVHHMHQTLRN